MHNVVCHMVRRDGSTTECYRIEITFLIVFFFHWLKPLNDEGREETGVPEKKPHSKAQIETFYNLLTAP